MWRINLSVSSKRRSNNKRWATSIFSSCAGGHTYLFSSHYLLRVCSIWTVSTILDTWHSLQSTQHMRIFIVELARYWYSSVQSLSLVSTFSVYTTKCIWLKAMKNKSKISIGGICSLMLTRYQVSPWKIHTISNQMSPCILDLHHIWRSGVMCSLWKY